MVHSIFRNRNEDAFSACRSCAKSGLREILSLGDTPLANALLTEDQLGAPEPTFPLELVFCPDCSLVQITEVVPPEILFRDYAYFSSFSQTMLDHAALCAKKIKRMQGLDSSSLVVELASNDGYLLKNYKNANIPVLGIEPAENIARVAQDQDIRTICDFFGERLAEKLVAQNLNADVIHANNVLAHVADLNGFVSGVEKLLKSTGIAVIEVPYLRDLIDQTEFDTIYHEHLCYFSLTALDALFRRHKLTIVDVERSSIHGGSLRIYAAKSGDPSRSVRDLLDEEKGWVKRLEYYQAFGERVDSLRTHLTKLLQNLKAEDKRIAVYGASAKGSTLLNYFDLGDDLLDFVVDRSTVKQGRYTPGTHLQICDPEKLVTDRPDYVLLLTWNFSEEILQQQSEYRRRGGRFIIPIPEVRVA
ncbi:MAG: class I SAM-dependent methyltransferase [Pirellulales bacterium]|nr:class I SAM-dependent methyltransferase [Pirellulales bacterium]